MGASESQCCRIFPANKDSANRGDGTRNWKGEFASVALVELRKFSDFIKERYLSSGDAFDKMFKIESNDELGTAAHPLETQRVDRKTFEHCCAVAGFTGRAGLVFDVLKDTDDYITRAGLKFRLTLPPTVVIKNWRETTYVSPAAGKDPAFLLPAFDTNETNCDELAKTEDTAETFKKMNRQHSLGSVSTAETCSESPRKLRRFENNEDVEALANTPPLPRKARQSSVEILGPPPAPNSPNVGKLSKIDGPPPAPKPSGKSLKVASDVLGQQPCKSGKVKEEDPTTGTYTEQALKAASVQPLYFSRGNGRKARPMPTPLDVACAFKQARGPYDMDLKFASALKAKFKRG